jgi:coproporphyrinogen III oxidase-like Fe-S oxidoreductase
MLQPRDFARLTEALRRTFTFATDCEIAIEIDPRTLTRDVVFALKEGGVTRASLGVQDFDPRVQKAVGRVQSFEQTARTADWLRNAGIVHINLDLMYGLIYQTVETVAETARRSLALNPGRIALFGYAHVPWMKRHQKLMSEEALPGARDDNNRNDYTAISKAILPTRRQSLLASALPPSAFCLKDTPRMHQVRSPIGMQLRTVGWQRHEGER